MNSANQYTIHPAGTNTARGRDDRKDWEFERPSESISCECRNYEKGVSIFQDLLLFDLVKN